MALSMGREGATVIPAFLKNWWNSPKTILGRWRNKLTMRRSTVMSSRAKVVFWVVVTLMSVIYFARCALLFTPLNQPVAVRHTYGDGQRPLVSSLSRFFPDD